MIKSHRTIKHSLVFPPNSTLNLMKLFEFVKNKRSIIFLENLLLSFVNLQYFAFIKFCGSIRHWKHLSSFKISKIFRLFSFYFIVWMVSSRQNIITLAQTLSHTSIVSRLSFLCVSAGSAGYIEGKLFGTGGGGHSAVGMSNLPRSRANLFDSARRPIFCLFCFIFIFIF